MVRRYSSMVLLRILSALLMQLPHDISSGGFMQSGSSGGGGAFGALRLFILESLRTPALLSGLEPAPLSGLEPAPLSGLDPAPLNVRNPAALSGLVPAPLSGLDPARDSTALSGLDKTDGVVAPETEVSSDGGTVKLTFSRPPASMGKLIALSRPPMVPQTSDALLIVGPLHGRLRRPGRPLPAEIAFGREDCLLLLV